MREQSETIARLVQLQNAIDTRELGLLEDVYEALSPSGQMIAEQRWKLTPAGAVASYRSQFCDTCSATGMWLEDDCADCGGLGYRQVSA